MKTDIEYCPSLVDFGFEGLGINTLVCNAGWNVMIYEKDVSDWDWDIGVVVEKFFPVKPTRKQIKAMKKEFSNLVRAKYEHGI